MANPSSSDYHRGEMDIHEQSATYAGFMNLTKWGSLILAVGLLFVTLWFCTGTGFLGLAGATNDIVANKFTFTGEGGST